MTTNADPGPPPRPAASGGERSGAGSNYGDWCPQRVLDQPDATTDGAAAPAANPPPASPRPEGELLPSTPPPTRRTP